jgi:hypothetical protein
MSEAATTPTKPSLLDKIARVIGYISIVWWIAIAIIVIFIMATGRYLSYAAMGMAPVGAAAPGAVAPGTVAPSGAIVPQ